MSEGVFSINLPVNKSLTMETHSVSLGIFLSEHFSVIKLVFNFDVKVC